MVLAAVAEVAAVRHVEHAAHERQGTPLVLDGGIEGGRARASRGADVHRPAAAHRAVVERQCEHLVPLGRPAIGRGHRGHVHRSRSRIDDGRAGDSQRVDVPARELREWNGRAELALPDDLPGGGVEGRHDVLLARDDEQARSPVHAGDVEGLRVEARARKRGGEICPHPGGGRARQGR